MKRLWLCAPLLSAALSCSVDPTTHPGYADNCPRGKTLRNHFCIPKKESDAGKDAGEDPDSGPIVTPDAGGPDVPQESCEPGEVTGCWPYQADIALSQQPPCRMGLWTCGKDGRWGDCDKAVGPSAEVCDGQDNDCDGTVDEGQLQKTCQVTGVVKGECAAVGAAFCSDGEEQCFASQPQAESCNGKDDDCDGTTDEGLDVPCYTAGDQCQANETGGFDCVPASTCKPGTRRCVDGVMQTDCEDQVGPQAEHVTGAGETPLDEDCDNHIDEGFSCQTAQEYPCYTGPAATRGKLPCKDGKITCSGGVLSACMNERTPNPETCANEGEDDDCDGEKDDVPQRGMPCNADDAQGVCKQTAVWQCKNGTAVCVPGEQKNETCDGTDEDCDGKVDEDFDLESDEMRCGSCTNRCGAGLACCGGACVSTSNSNQNCNGCGNACGAGLSCCSGTCVNTLTDKKNCGACARGCLLTNCSNGGCL